MTNTYMLSTYYNVYFLLKSTQLCTFLPSESGRLLKPTHILPSKQQEISKQHEQKNKTLKVKCFYLKVDSGYLPRKQYIISKVILFKS